MKQRTIAGIGTTIMMGGLLAGALLAAAPADAQVYRYRYYSTGSRAPNGDFDRDGIRNRRDRDIDNDGIRNGRDRNDYTRRRYRYRVGGWRATLNDWDGDGRLNHRDRHPRNPRRW